MITPSEIKTKAGKKYLAFLQSTIDGIPFFPLVIAGNKKPSRDIATYQSEISLLMASSKEKKGYGYTIEYQTVKTRAIGRVYFFFIASAGDDRRGVARQVKPPVIASHGFPGRDGQAANARMKEVFS